MKSSIQILFLLLGLVCGYAWGDINHQLEMETGSRVKGHLKIKIFNSISAQDYADLSTMVSLAKKGFGSDFTVFAELNSTGGNISASLNIGKILRKYDAMAYIAPDSVCMSSCVYILAGATQRVINDGTIGIHRPYEPNDESISADVQKTKYGILGKKIIAYLKAMNISIRLYEDSLFISPDNIKILSSQEMQIYGLNVNDPFTEEANAVKKANELGISRMEYAKRKNRVKSECVIDRMADPDSEEWAKCVDEIYDGRH
jgi:hypothetical protein